VPEAAVDENDEPQFWKNNIRPDREPVITPVAGSSSALRRLNIFAHYYSTSRCGKSRAPCINLRTTKTVALDTVEDHVLSKGPLDTKRAQVMQFW
jgi:hypothetical protein